MSDDRQRQRALAGVPGMVRIVDVGGVSTSMIEAGDGPALLLLHGGIESGGVIWTPVLSALSLRHRVVVPDLPGLGASAPVDRLDDATFDRWLTGVLEETGLEQPTVVAHSLGGSLAARFAARHPASFGGIVLYGAPGVGPYRMPLALQYCAVRFAIRPTARNAERFDRFLLHDLDATRALDPEWYSAFDAYTRSLAGERHVKRTMRRLIGLGTKRIPDADLARLADVTLLWGRHDRMVPVAVAESAASRHGWPLLLVDGAAHAPHVEQPGAFVDALARATGGRLGESDGSDAAGAPTAAAMTSATAELADSRKARRRREG